MAGPFYNAATGIGLTSAGASATESPVAPVTISAADGVTAGLNLASQGVSLYAQDQRYKNRSGKSKGSSSDPNLARFSEEMDKVQQIRETQGENAARMAERQVGTNFAGVGIAFDTDYQRVYQQKTGKNYNLYGKDEEAAYRDAMLKSDSVRNNITASYAVLGPQATFEERVNWSLNQDAVVKAAALTVDISQANATLKWNQKVDGKPSPKEAYTTVLDSFTATSLGAFERAVSTGQTVTAQDIADSKAQFTQVLASLSRPPGLTGTDGDAQWKVFTDKTEKIKAMYEALENATSSKVLQETMTQHLADAIGKATDISDVDKAIATLGAIKGDPTILNALAGNIGDVAKALSKVDFNIPKNSSSMFSFNLGSTLSSGGPNSFAIDPKIKDLVSGQTPQEVVDNIRGSAAFAKVFDPKAMNNRENHEPFRNMASTIAAVLHSDKQENFLSPEFIAANITNPKMMAALRSYSANDPDLGARLMGGYSEGLKLEKLRQTYNLQSVETSDLGKYVLFDKATNTYKLNEVAFAVDSGELGNLYTEETSRKLGAFNRSIEELYGNNLSEAARDGFKKIFAGTSRDPQDIVDIGRLRFLTNAVKRRDAISALDKGISDLTLNQETGQTELNQGQTMDQAPPPAVVQPADQGIDTSPRPTDEGDGRSLLQRGLEMVFSPAAAAELTPELRAQLEAVRTRLPPTRPEGLPGDTPEVKSTLAPPMEAVSRVIVKGESPLGYGDWNRGTSNGIPLNKAVDGKTVADNNIVELTHEEHLARSVPSIKADDPQKLFAIGRYQIIPTTAEGAFKFLGYSKKQKYTPEVQDNMFKYLLMGKRKPLYDYIKDEKGSDKDKAVLEMAKEFASIGVPYDVQVTVNKRKVTRKKGDSYYGQPAPTTPEDTGKQLDALRELYKKDPDALEPMGPKQKQAKAARTTLPPRRPEDTFVEDMRAAIDISPRPKN